MNSLFFCNCGSQQFERMGDNIICSRCKKSVNKNEMVGFLDPSDSKLKPFITKLGFDMGIEVAKLGVGTLIGIFLPWAYPFTSTALGVIIRTSGNAISNAATNKLFCSGPYGKKIEAIFQKELDNILKKGKRSIIPYNYFYNYHNYCLNHFSDLLSYLIDNDINTDIFSEEAVRAIVSAEYRYPGYNEPEVLNSILQVSNEFHNIFEKKIIEDKNVGFRWLTEKRIDDQDNKIQRLFELLEANYEDNSIDDDTYEYIKNYNRPLFLDLKTGITLGQMYLEPITEGRRISAIEAISNWYNDDNQLLFVYGAAGVGKTSLVTKIISDIYGTSGKDSILNLDKNEIHPIILRDKSSYINDKTQNGSYSALKIIEDIIKKSEYDLNNHLIILDGFDELCVLANKFDGKTFIKKLIKDLKSTNIKVMITSRAMKKTTKFFEPGLSKIKIIWTKSQIIEWCDKFSKLTQIDEEKNWCDNFKTNYLSLFNVNENDNRLDMFSVPIILYLACKSNTLISANDTIGKFYDNVFRTIVDRKHIENHKSSGVYIGAEDERKTKLINWQFTKEIAYQMFLNDTLTLTNNDKSGNDLIEYAKTRTIDILSEKSENITKDTDIDTELYLAVSYFANGKEKGIEFAHKTVYEYFTAVKLYEDYFAEFNKEFFSKYDNSNYSEAVKKVWENIIEAFRCTKITEDIFNYLNEMKRPKYNGYDDNQENGFDYHNFEKCYIEGIKNHILSEILIDEITTEYKVKAITINNQICCAFRNLTWFLTGHKYKNDVEELNYDYIRELVSADYSDINCSSWDLSNYNFSNTILNEATFEGSKLYKANFKNSILQKTIFNNANLTEADMSSANLAHSQFKEATMIKIDLSTSNLYSANLNKAFLNEAILRETYVVSATLKEADLSDSLLINTVCRNSDFIGATFSRAQQGSADFSGAKI